MKGWLKYVVILSVMLAGLVYAFSWLLGTPSGALFLFEAVSRLSPVKINVEKINGRIIDTLFLEQITFQSSYVKARIDQLVIRWQPTYLLAGRITFRDMDISHVYFQDDRPESNAPPDLTPPKIHGLLAMVQAEVKSFHIAQLTYHRMNRTPITLENLSSHVSWDRGILRLKHFSLKTIEGYGEGAGELNFLNPTLYLKGVLSLKQAIVGLDQFAIDLKLEESKPRQEMAGPLILIGKSSSVERLRLTGNLGVNSNNLRLNHFVLSQFGRHGEVTFDGEVEFSSNEPFINLRLKLKDVDLSKQLIVAQKLTGELSLKGHPSAYGGLFIVENSGPAWQAERLAGSIEGNLSHIKISNLDGSWLDGTLKGHLEMTRKQGISFAGALQGRGLNPSRINTDWQGQVNLDAQGELHLPEDRPLSGNLKIHLLKSRLRGKILMGEIEAQVQEGRLFLSRAEFQGSGFDLSAHGDLEERLNFAARVSDLASLIPKAQGSFFAKGWIRWRNHQLAGSLSGQGKNISLGKIRISALNVQVRLDEDENGLVDVKANVRKLVYGSILIDSLLMDATGTVDNHKIEMALYWPEGELKASLKGAYTNEAWQGMVTHFAGKSPREVSWRLFSPSSLTFTRNKVKFGPLQIVSTTGEQVRLFADLALHPIKGFVEANWKQLDLGLITLYLGKPHLAGHTTGELKAEWTEYDRLHLTASMEAAGTFQNHSIKLELPQASLSFQWDEKGLQGSWKMVLAKEGQVDGQITSSQPARLSLPEQATVMADWKAIDLSLLKAWLPRDLTLEGRCSGRLSGNWLESGPFDTEGEMKVSHGVATWRGNEGIIRSVIQAMDADWSWHRDVLRGKASLVLADYGDIKGRFQLPLNARLPVTIQKTGPLEVSVQCQIQESGLLTTLFAEAIQESRGKVDLNLKVDGTWEKPSVHGYLKLTKAGAYLPRVGIRLEDMEAEAQFTQDQIRIVSFRARSDPGHIAGTATFWMKDWRISRFEGHLEGDRFQTIYLPELRVLTNPRLDVEGIGERMIVKGEILVPEGEFLDLQTKEVVRTSPDVFIVGAKKASPSAPIFPLDAKVRVLLGDKVWFKAEGIDARLVGSVILQIRNSKEISAIGEIQTAEGHYSYYGQKLEITRGHLLFDGPLENPTLDVLALRKIKSTSRWEEQLSELQVGVVVTGKLQSPVIRLYSQPSMADVDILSYLVLGQPAVKSRNEEQTALITQAASALLSAGGSVLTQSQLLRSLRIDTLDIQTGKGDISRSLVTIGKHLDPRLYVGLGGSLFTNTYQVILRYSLTKHIEIETKAGTQSGANVYFKIEFE
jgi:translocation and assembly module TamB